MKKEDILEMSRKENKNKDIYEIEVENKGCRIASISMLILATVYYCYEIYKGIGENITLYSLINIYCSVMYGYKGFKVEKNRFLNMFCSIIWTILTILLVLEYFKVI